MIFGFLMYSLRTQVKGTAGASWWLSEIQVKLNDESPQVFMPSPLPIALSNSSDGIREIYFAPIDGFDSGERTSVCG